MQLETPLQTAWNVLNHCSQGVIGNVRLFGLRYYEIIGSKDDWLFYYFRLQYKLLFILHTYQQFFSRLPINWMSNAGTFGPNVHLAKRHYQEEHIIRIWKHHYRHTWFFSSITVNVSNFMFPSIKILVWIFQKYSIE